MTDVSRRGGKRWWRQESGSEMVWKNDLDSLCRLISKEFKPATDKIVRYGEQRMRLKIMCNARFCMDSKCWDWARLILLCIIVFSGPTLSLDTRVPHTVLNDRYHFNQQMLLDRDGRQCVSAGITYSYCRLRPVVRDTEQFLQVAMGMKQWDCVSFSVWCRLLFERPFFHCRRRADYVGWMAQW